MNVNINIRLDKEDTALYLSVKKHIEKNVNIEKYIFLRGLSQYAKALLIEVTKKAQQVGKKVLKEANQDK